MKYDKFTSWYLSIFILLILPNFILLLAIYPIKNIKNLSLQELEIFIFIMLLLSLIIYGIVFFLIKKIIIEKSIAKDDITIKKVIEIAKELTYLATVFGVLIITFANATTANKNDEQFMSFINMWNTRSIVFSTGAFSLTVYQFFFYKLKKE